MKVQAMAAVPMAAAEPVTSFRKSRLVTSEWSWCATAAADKSAIFPSISSQPRPGAGRTKPRADLQARPEFQSHATGGGGGRAHTRVVPAPLQHVAGRR